MVIMVIAVPRIGTTGWVMAALVGQLTAAMVIDRLGLFGLEQRPVGWAQILGILMVLVGTLIAVRA